MIRAEILNLIVPTAFDYQDILSTSDRDQDETDPYDGEENIHL
jgi:hypothetical protein